MSEAKPKGERWMRHKVHKLNIRAHSHPHTYIVRLTDRADKNVIENLAGTSVRYDPIILRPVTLRFTKIHLTT